FPELSRKYSCIRQRNASINARTESVYTLSGQENQNQRRPWKGGNMQRTFVRCSHRIFALALLALPLGAQWINHPTPGTPRTKEGKPNLSAPVPKTRDGKPDFSGVWSAPNFSTKYLQNLAADGVDVPMLPWAAALYKQRQENGGKDRPSGHCLPHSVTDFDAHHMPK